MKTAIRICAVLVALLLWTGVQNAFCGSAAPGRKELQRIKREMREKKKRLRQANRKERSILAELEGIDRDIQKEHAILREQRRRLRDAEAALRAVERHSADTTNDLHRVRQSSALRLRALYKICRRGQDEASFAFADAAGAIRHTRYLGRFTAQDRMLVREYGGALEKLAARQQVIAKKRRDILSRQRSVERREAALKVSRRSKTRLLASVKDKKGVYEQTLRELEASSTSLWAMIRKDEQRRKALREAARREKKGISSPSSDGNRLPWPLEGQVLSRYGMQRHPEFGTMVFRRGIEIEASEGDPVRSVEGGEVAFADWYRGYGKLVILDHGDGFYTLYGNLSQLLVSPGSRVTKGRTIGRAGDTGSLRGPRLYFEVRRNGEARDPLAWLAKK